MLLYDLNIFLKGDSSSDNDDDDKDNDYPSSGMSGLEELEEESK